MTTTFAKVRVASSNLVIRSIGNAAIGRVSCVLGADLGRVLPMVCPCVAHDPPMTRHGVVATSRRSESYRWGMSGALRQRSPGAWELRVYLGVDADSGRQRWATKTVRGSRRYANAALAEFVAEAGYAKIWAGSVADLLDRWMDQASPNWSATTLRQTASIINHHLKP